MSTREDQFAELFSGSQQRLLGYVIGLVRNVADAHDILQQTAITAWRKFDEFDPDTDFMRWVIAIARFETLNFMKYRRRSKVLFDQSLIEQLGESVCDASAELIEDRGKALSLCIKKLSAADSRLIQCRYSHGLNSSQIAEVLDRSQSSVCNSLKRIRESLLGCIERRLSKEENRG